MSSSPHNPTSARPSITDSAWFWAMLFSCVSLLAMQLIDWKYNQRQAQLERQFQGREWASQHGAKVQMNAQGDVTRGAPVPVVASDPAPAANSVAAGPNSAVVEPDPSATSPGMPSAPNYSRPGQLVISLWPLRVLALTTLVLSSILLWRKKHSTLAAAEPVSS